MAEPDEASVLRLVVVFLRFYADMTQAEFGKASRVDQSDISKYEKGTKPPPEEVLRRMAKAANLIVVPFFISDGLHSYEDIPVMLGESEAVVQERLNHREPTWRNPTERQGKLLWYTMSIGSEAHIADVILERVNRFLGWSAVGRLALRQAPLSRRERSQPVPPPDPHAVESVAQTLTAIEDEELRAALARLGAVIKRN